MPEQPERKLGGMGGLFFTDGEEGSISNIAQANILGRKWLLNYEDLVIGEKLAAGSSGQVFRGIFCGKPVAVKNLYVAVEHMGAFLEGNAVDEGEEDEEMGGRPVGNAKKANGKGKKTPPANTPPTAGPVGGGDEVCTTVREFVSETKILSRLRHENIVCFYGVCHHLQDLYIVQELCACSLRDLTYHRLARMRANAQRLLQGGHSGDSIGGKGRGLNKQVDDPEPGLTIRVVVRLLRELACGMAYVHAKGLIHRDLKPANLLLDEKPPSMMDEAEKKKRDQARQGGKKGGKGWPQQEGEQGGQGEQEPKQSEAAAEGDEILSDGDGIGVVKICDFGLARWWAHTKTGREATMTGCGTPFYMAPELIMGHRCAPSRCGSSHPHSQPLFH
jgi:serine/threonine protein kinase